MLSELPTVITAVAVPIQPAVESPLTVYVVFWLTLAVTTDPVVVLRPIAGDHVYESAPVANKLTELPEQIVAELTLIVGEVLTVTTLVLVDEQPADDTPITVYVVLVVGLAVTVLPVIALIPVEGVQLQVAAPVAVSVPLNPLQILNAGVDVSAGNGLTVTTDVVLPVQPFEAVPVIVYVVELSGVAVTLDPVTALNPLDGAQLQLAAPLAVNVEVPPAHRLNVAGATDIAGCGLTVTTDVVLDVQPLDVVPTIVQVVVTMGLALTELPVVELRPEFGDQLQVVN